MVIFSSPLQPKQQWSMMKFLAFSMPKPAPAMKRLSVGLARSASSISPTRKRRLRMMTLFEPPKFTLPPRMRIPSPGAVCPAIVTFFRLARNSRFFWALTPNLMIPLTRKTMVAFSLPATVSAHRSEPSEGLAGSSSRLVTSTTLQPLPPETNLPKPRAVGKASNLFSKGA